MLILSRKIEESIIITTLDGQEITIKILNTSSGQIKLGITAPDDVNILRAELAKE